MIITGQRIYTYYAHSLDLINTTIVFILLRLQLTKMAFVMQTHTVTDQMYKALQYRLENIPNTFSQVTVSEMRLKLKEASIDRR